MMSEDNVQNPKPYEPLDPVPETTNPFQEPAAGHTEHGPHDPGTIVNPRGDNWIWGIALIVLGGLFLLQNLTPFRFINWWAIFILIPAAGSFVSAWRKYQTAGRFSSGVRNSLFGGLIFSVVAAMFLFNLDLGQFWPVFVIAAGLAVMANALLPD